VPALGRLAWIWDLPGVGLLVAGLHLASAARRCRGCPGSLEPASTTTEPWPPGRQASRPARGHDRPGSHPPMRGARWSTSKSRRAAPT
jgi:hypothetical protein